MTGARLNKCLGIVKGGVGGALSLSGWWLYVCVLGAGDRGGGSLLPKEAEVVIQC